MTDVHLSEYHDRSGDRRWRVVAQTLKHGNAPKTISVSSEGYRDDDSYQRSKLLTLQAHLEHLGDDALELVLDYLARHVDNGIDADAVDTLRDQLLGPADAE